MFCGVKYLTYLRNQDFVYFRYYFVLLMSLVMPPSKTLVLNLYKTLLREACKFSSYNFRNYALRRIKDSFRENKNVLEGEKIESHFNEAKKNLEIIRRQVIIGKMYDTDKLVIEHEIAK